MDRRSRLAEARLYLCTPDRVDLADFVSAVCRAGVDVVQLRDKALEDDAVVGRGRVARRAAHEAGALYVVNDSPDLVDAVGADGVHVGQDDASPAQARATVGPDRLVGLSTHAPAELDGALGEPVDYVSVGPVVETPTKPGRPGTGLGYVEYAAERCPLPFFVTGGVSPQSVPSIAAAGATRFVVVRALTEAPTIDAAVAVVHRLQDLMAAYRQ